MVSLAMGHLVSREAAPTTFVPITKSAFLPQLSTADAKKDSLVMKLVPVLIETNARTTKPIATEMLIA